MEFDYILHGQAESNNVLGCVKKNVAEKLQTDFNDKYIADIHVFIYARNLLM